MTTKDEHPTATPPLTRELLADRLSAVGGALQRIFFANATIALIILYLVFDEKGLLHVVAAPPSRVRTAISGRIERLEPIVQAGMFMRSHPEIVQSYRAFLGRFTQIEDATDQAIRHRLTDPRWLALSATDRQLLRSSGAAIETAFQLDLYDADDLRDGPVTYITTFAETFVYQERWLDDASALAKLQACVRVAKAFGVDVEAPQAWPQSFSFRAFVKPTNKYSDLMSLLDAARLDGNALDEVPRLAAICDANHIEFCSINTLQGYLQRGELKLDTTGSAERIEISFLPTGFERRFLIAAAPVALFVGFYLFLAQYRRRQMIARLVQETCGESDRRILESPWLLSNALDESLAAAWFVPIQSVIVKACLLVGETLPVAAQLVVVWYLWRLWPGGRRVWPWLLLSLTTFTLTFYAWFALIREQQTSFGLTGITAKIANVFGRRR